jgi:uncharacterized protein (TIGR03000 family)
VPAAPKGDKKSALDTEATFMVRLPADATLSIDGVPTSSQSGERQFVTPSLEKGKEYSYTLTAQLTLNGKPVSVTRQLTVRAGEETSVKIEFPESVAAK